MESIQIRDVPDPIHRTLRERAARAGVSLSEDLLSEVTRVPERLAVSDVLRLATGRSGGVGVEKIVESLRSGRDQN
ncbi:MAG: hypothetical protein WD178_10210 [Actinomycetota bacterium]